MKTEETTKVRNEVIELTNKLNNIDTGNHQNLLNMKGEIITFGDRHSGILTEISENFQTDLDKMDNYIKIITGLIEDRNESIKTNWIKFGWEFHVGSYINKLLKENEEIFKLLIAKDIPNYHWTWIVPEFKYKEKLDELENERQQIFSQLNPTGSHNAVEWGKGCTLTDSKKKKLRKRLLEIKPTFDFLISYQKLIIRQKDLSYFNLQFEYNNILSSGNLLKFELGYLLFINLHEFAKAINQDYTYLKEKTSLKVEQKKIDIETKAGNTPVKKQFQTLKEIFLNESDFDKALNALKKLNLIDENNNNLKGNELKGIMQVWVNILKTDKHLIESISDTNLTILLNQQFANLNLSENTDGKTLRNMNKTAEKRYRAKLLAYF